MVHHAAEGAEQRSGFIEAIHRNELAAHARGILLDQTASPDERRRAEVAVATCAAIGDEVARERARLVHLLSPRLATASKSDGDGPKQRHTMTIDVAARDVALATQLLETDGYARQRSWRRGAERSFVRNSSQVVLSRSADVTTVVQLRWRPPTAPGPIGRVMRPTPGDWDLVELPVWAWWGYSVVRPVRLLLERVGLRPRDHGRLEPFLATPASLISPLLEVASVDENDVVVDFGCGDGRIVIEAARRTGCRAVGVEQLERLAAEANRAVEEAGLTDRVRIARGDGRELPLDRVTVVVMFLPIVVAQRVIPIVIDRLRPGARILLHEQSRLPASFPTPDASTAVIADDAVTVAHRWDVTANA